MNVAEAIARILKQEGSDILVCYPRQLLIDACTALGIRPVICRQERVGAGIADGISRSTNGRRLGIFAMQGGPGLENAFPGIAQVYADNVPVLLLPAGPLGRRNTPPHFYALEHFGKVTKWAAEIDKPARVSELMRRAFHHLRSGRPGPVLLEIPNDVVESDIGAALEYSPVKRVRSAPDPADVRAVAELLLKSACPVLHVGQGTMYAQATGELVKLAELIQAPVMTTNTGKSAFPENHPLSIGASVISAPKAVFHFLKKADLIVGVGASFTVNPWTPKIPPGKRIVHITNDPADINKEVPNVAAILGDAKLVLEALVAEIGSRKRSDDGIAAEIRAIKHEWLQEWMPELKSAETPINQYRVIHDLMHAVDPANVIITHEAGSPREQLVPFWESHAPRGYLGWGKSTQLGHGLGLIMGAKLANPEKLCINLMGDASMGMVGMDLETAVRSRIGILTIVFNNGVMAGEKNSMPLSVEKHRAMDLGGNYSQVAKALGAWSTRIEEPDAFLPALRQAIEVTQDGAPALIECVAKQNYRFSRY
ncbi:MAG TPA: thiamine pyrophosphate-requiring protein [Burkholderiales bacterium]|nr:thiamine pyrophosphate-requiring protein [Burkholderiales bacterium]